MAPTCSVPSRGLAFLLAGAFQQAALVAPEAFQDQLDSGEFEGIRAYASEGCDIP